MRIFKIEIQFMNQFGLSENYLSYPRLHMYRLSRALVFKLLSGIGQWFPKFLVQLPFFQAQNLKFIYIVEVDFGCIFITKYFSI